MPSNEEFINEAELQAIEEAELSGEVNSFSPPFDAPIETVNPAHNSRMTVDPFFHNKPHPGDRH